MSTRKKNAEATREAILDAARVVFTRHGYESAGVREIAAAAGANAALVNRYFGSKLKLFEEAVTATISVSEYLPADRAEFCRNFVPQVLNERSRGQPGFDPTHAMLRSASNAEVTELVHQAIEERIIGPLADWLGGDDAELRSALIAAIIAGVSVFRDVLGVAALASDEAALNRRLSALLEVLVFEKT